MLHADNCACCDAKVTWQRGWHPQLKQRAKTMQENMSSEGTGPSASRGGSEERAIADTQEPLSDAPASAESGVRATGHDALEDSLRSPSEVLSYCSPNFEKSAMLYADNCACCDVKLTWHRGCHPQVKQLEKTIQEQTSATEEVDFEQGVSPTAQDPLPLPPPTASAGSKPPASTGSKTLTFSSDEEGRLLGHAPCAVTEVA